MPSREFIVQISTYDDNEWALDPSDVYTALTDAVGYSRMIWVNSVRAYTAPGVSFPGKIQAIKHLRFLLDPMKLVEAKDVIDAATSLGRFRLAGGVMVEYDADTGKYTISDERQ